MADRPAYALFPDAPPAELITERELERRLEVSRSTIWRLRAEGMPSITVGRSVRYDWQRVHEWLRKREHGEDTSSPATSRVRKGEKAGDDGLFDCHWSLGVAFDPKHRPQVPNRPSSTVRREWWRFPQEAHLLDPLKGRYRRMRADEMAVLQGFPRDWGRPAGLDELVMMRGFGDSVPPPLAEVLISEAAKAFKGDLRTSVEICAGFGGLALGASRAADLEHLALVERWEPACEILKATQKWPKDRVVCGDVREIKWSSFAGKVDLLTGGPPCQPWSNAGKGLGLGDERDLLGFMPELVATVRPRMFIFENVPGLLMGENDAYARHLIAALREPADGLSYAVACAVFNAADFGVPQARRRIFIVGMRDCLARDVHNYFDSVYARRSHSNPSYAIPTGMQPWRTIQEALPDWAEGDHKWRRWPTPTEEGAADTMPKDGAEAGRLRKRTDRIQLDWPSKGLMVSWSEGWKVLDLTESAALRHQIQPLMPDKTGADFPHFVSGDTIPTLEALNRSFGHRAELVYVDLPRIRTNSAAFPAADASSVLDTWLTLVQALLRQSLRLLHDGGALAVVAGIQETPYAELLLKEIAGPNNHVGTAAWQRHYSPRGMPNMKELSPTHDNIIIFARRKERLKPVALTVPPKGFKHPDGDPRGPWKAEQKGANKSDCDYSINICPYRWEVVDGELPPGFWRLNPKTGVLWAPEGSLTEEGEFKFTVEVRDSAGNSARQAFSVTVAGSAVQPPLPDIPWLATTAGQPFYDDGKPLRIITEQLPNARLGHEYSVCIVAAGGKPWLGTTRPGKTSKSGKSRYWEFPLRTLVERTARDAVDYKKQDEAIPALKTYLSGRDTATLNLTSVWTGRGRDEKDPFGSGFTQDAKQELSDLLGSAQAGENVAGLKPQALLLRLLALFSSGNGVVVDVGSPSAEMAGTATAAGRDAIYVEYPSNADLREGISYPRLKAAAEGACTLPPEYHFVDEEGEQPEKAVLLSGRRRPPSGDANVCRMKLSGPFAEIDRQAGYIAINYGDYPIASDAFLAALASVEGLLPEVASESGVFGRSLDGRLLAVYQPETVFVDPYVLDEIKHRFAEHFKNGGRVRVYYHRGVDEISVSGDPHLQVARIPFTLTIAAGVL